MLLAMGRVGAGLIAEQARVSGPLLPTRKVGAIVPVYCFGEGIAVQRTSKPTIWECVSLPRTFTSQSFLGESHSAW